jgi:NAD(P)H-dependent FMN reductase
MGASVATWFTDFANQHAKFDVSLIDLAEIALPIYDEPNHPSMQKYTKEHTKAWSATVASADAYTFVTPEYNHNPPPAFYNALNFVYKEWNYKPCSFVSYGGVSGGLRAVHAAKLLVTTLKMVPIVESVPIPMIAKLLDENKLFMPNELINASAKTMLDELFRWAEGLQGMRPPKNVS